MAYENQIKCISCGMSIPDVPEDANISELLCDKCEKMAEARESQEDDVWSDFSEYPVSNWQYEVANGDTRRGYWDWVVSKIEEMYS